MAFHIEIIDLEGDDGAPQGGRELHAFGSPKHHITTEKTEVDRKHRGQGTDRHRDSPDRAMGRKGQALGFGEEFEAGIDQAVTLESRRSSLGFRSHPYKVRQTDPLRPGQKVPL